MVSTGGAPSSISADSTVLRAIRVYALAVLLSWLATRWNRETTTTCFDRFLAAFESRLTSIESRSTSFDSFLAAFVIFVTCDVRSPNWLASLTDLTAGSSVRGELALLLLITSRRP